MNEVPYPGFDKPEEYETFTTTNDLEEVAEKEAIEYAKREKPKDADGEIWRVGDVMIENRMSFEDGFIAGAKWQEKRNLRFVKQVLSGDFTVFEAGRKYEREQMMKETVEGKVEDVGVNYIDLIDFDAEKLGLVEGDKVRIIIVKEDEK